MPSTLLDVINLSKPTVEGAQWAGNVRWGVRWTSLGSSQAS